MLITNLKKENTGEKTRVSATVAWEENPHKTQEVYFETLPHFSDDLNVSPDAFLAGCYLPAMFSGEQRIRIDGDPDLTLREGIERNMRTFRGWYGKRMFKPLRIEAAEHEKSPALARKNRTALFFSGGIDSLYSLKTNRIAYSLDNPYSIQDGFLIHGFDIHHDEDSEINLPAFNRALAAAGKIARDADMTIIPVFTNIRHILSGVDFWMKWFHGAALTAVAHCFSSRISTIHIASSHQKENLEPWGSHPRIDPNHGSSLVRIIHDPLFPRVKKTLAVADWPTALQNLRVCTTNDPALLNCGKCAKCILVMLILFAAGRLKETQAFPDSTVSPQELKSVLRKHSLIDIRVNYAVLAGALAARGRKDLTRVINSEIGPTGIIRRIDASLLHGTLQKIYAAVISRVRRGYHA